MLLQALGVHGHGAEDTHDHSEDEGLVIKPFVWYATIACAGEFIVK